MDTLPVYHQLNSFARELLRMIDEGQDAPISEVCDHIEQGTIVHYVEKHCGFRNINVTPETIADVDDHLRKIYVSEREARVVGITQNGLVYLVRIIIDTLADLLFKMETNDIDVSSYW